MTTKEILQAMERGREVMACNNAPMGNHNAAGPHKVGDVVRLKKPGLHGPVSIGGTVKRLLPDGKIEVKSQQDGYFVIHHSEATKP